MSLANKESLLPGLEAEEIKGIRKKSILLACLSSFLLFGLLPLSEFAREEQWVVREADVQTIKPPPPPPPTEVEKIIKNHREKVLQAPRLDTAVANIDTTPMNISLDVTPGDFKAAFSLANYNPAPNGFGEDLFFALHELDRNPSVLNRGKLIYPSHLKRKGLEGEVKLLVQIDKQGRVKVLEVVTTTHPDFAKSAKTAAESSVYEAPRRNGELVITQFYLPIRFTLLDN